MPRQRGAIVKRYNRYSVKYRTPEGKQKWESGFETKAAAQSRLNELLLEIDKGSYVEPKTVTFAEFAVEWLQSRSSIRGSTLSAYASIVKQQLVPYFGGMRLTDMGYEHVQSFVDKLRGHVSPKTVHNTVILLRVMLTGKKGPSAVKRGFFEATRRRGWNCLRVTIGRSSRFRWRPSGG